MSTGRGFEWKNGSLISKAKVNINGTVYEVEEAQYEGETPVSAENMNAMQEIIFNEIDVLSYNLISNADPIKTGRKINNKDEYVKRIEKVLVNHTVIGGNFRYEIETGLSNVKFTKPISGFVKSLDSQLDINMVRFEGSTLSNVSHSAYLNENNCKIIFETAGYNRDGLTITADLYFTYQNEQAVEES